MSEGSESQRAHQRDGALSGQIPPRVRPDDAGVSIVREQALESGNVLFQALWIRASSHPLRHFHVARYRLHVEIDGFNDSPPATKPNRRGLSRTTGASSRRP